MEPKVGYVDLATAVHFAAESSIGIYADGCTTGDRLESADVRVYYVDPGRKNMNIGYLTLLLDRNIVGGCASLRSLLVSLTAGNSQSLSVVTNAKIHDHRRICDGPSFNVVDGLVVGTILKHKPNRDLQFKPYAED